MNTKTQRPSLAGMSEQAAAAAISVACARRSTCPAPSKSPNLWRKKPVGNASATKDIRPKY